MVERMNKFDQLSLSSQIEIKGLRSISVRQHGLERVYLIFWLKNIYNFF